MYSNSFNIDGHSFHHVHNASKILRVHSKDILRAYTMTSQDFKWSRDWKEDLLQIG